jgi:hypothetical protein
MQVFIERAQNYSIGANLVYLYFQGGIYLKFKYLYRLMEHCVYLIA